MPNRDRVFDVTRLLNNTEPLNREVYLALENLRECFEKNYVRKIYSAANSEERKVKDHPNREVVLLRALKNFTSREQLSNIDNAIEMINFISTMQNVQSDLGHYSHNQKSIAIKSEDGEEVFVSNQSLQTTKLLMLLALMKKL